jgi:hypothetical protein
MKRGQNTFNNRISVPALKERVEKERWQFILYDKLKVFFHDTKEKQKINHTEFEELAQKPRSPPRMNETLDPLTDQ